MFKLVNATNKENIIRIQGARATNSSNPVATILFQNFDNDTSSTYNMAGISCYDHFGNSDNNGIGDLVFTTNATGQSNVQERMRVMYNGNIKIGPNASETAKLNVDGDIQVTQQISANNLNVSKISALTNRIVLKGNSLTDSFINIKFDASNITTGTLSQNVLPSNVSFSNVNANNIATHQLIFKRATSNIVIANSSSNSDAITYYKDWSDWTPSISNAAISSTNVDVSRYSVLNNTVTMNFTYNLTVTGSNMITIRTTLPYRSASVPCIATQHFYNPQTATLQLARSVISSSNFDINTSGLTPGQWQLAGTAFYESA